MQILYKQEHKIMTVSFFHIQCLETEISSHVILTWRLTIRLLSVKRLIITKAAANVKLDSDDQIFFKCHK